MSGGASIEWFAQVDGRRVSGATQLAKAGLALSVMIAKYPGGTRHAASVTNTGSDEMLVEEVGAVLRWPAGRGRRSWRVFLDKGNCGWCGVKRLNALEDDPYMQPVYEQRMGDEAEDARPIHRSDLQTLAWDAKSKQARLVGFLRQRHGGNWIDIVPNRRATDIRHMEAHQSLAIRLGPGQSQDTDVLVIAEGDDPLGMLDCLL